MSTTALYSPYKAVGYVTDGNPFCINRLGEDTFLTTSVGKAFQVYRFDRLTVCLASRPAPGIITAIQCCGHETFCAIENDIVVYDRTQIVRTYKVHQQPIAGMLMIGRTLISYDQENHIKVIDTKARRLVAEMTSLQPSKIVCIMHPATYVNKVVVGYANGQMELWNIQKRAIIYTFAAHLSYLEDGRTSRRSRSSSKDIFMDPYGDDDDDDEDDDVDAPSSSSSRRRKSKKVSSSKSVEAVTCIEQSPACDVLGVGFSSGDVLLLNAKLDVVLFSFRQDGGSVTSISFRTDAAADRFPFMVTASADGRLHVWNLGLTNSAADGAGGGRLERKLENSLHEAHSAAIGRVHFLYGEPVMVSAAADNTIKVWIFDSPDGTARILRSREGHSGWPLRIRYYGGSTNASIRDNSDATSCEILSAGSDGTLRLFNTAIEVQNRELSQNTILKKLGMQRRNERLPVTIGFDFSETRQRDWGDLVTIHKNHANAYVWKFKNRTVTEMILRQPSWPKNEKAFTVDRSTHATAVVMSPCGNYCAVGTRGGVIYLYNVQSGLPRGAFPASKTLGAIKAGLLKQRQAVPGNVYHQHKSFVEEGKGGETNSLKLNKNKPPQGSDATAGSAATATGDDSMKDVAHTQAVTGMFIEIANTVMVTCGLDGKVIFWDFGTKDVLHRVALKSPAMMLQGFQDGGFVAVASQDRTVRVFDVFTYKLSRRFSGHSREISDMAFAPDGRRLLTSSLDSTVRVWDMPTGRCLSWLSFQAPVLSMTMSHSGEFLCLTQADKEGIFMYVDRSLYETVHFWKEPTAPISVADSLVLIESKDPTEDASGDVSGAEGQGMDGGAAADGDGDDDEEKDANEGEGGGAGELVLPAQAQVAVGVARESTAQRGPRTLTMAAVPRAYWTSLFNLEAIKARNRASAAPEAPQRAPFFLPTVVRGGATPSFPTPVEFAQLMKQQQEQQQAAEGIAAGAGKQSSSSTTTTPASSSSSSQALASGKAKGKNKGGDSKGGDGDSEAVVLAELAAMGSAWDDDGEGGADWGDEGDDDDEGTSPSRATIHAGGKKAKLNDDNGGKSGVGGGSGLLARTRTGSEVGLDDQGYVLDRRPMSRIIHRKTALPRCKLVAFLLREYPDYNHLHHHQSHSHNSRRDGFFSEAGSVFVGEGSGSGHDDTRIDDDCEDGPILEYLKQLPPPAVDVELRALCTHKDDEEGLSLLRCLLAWFARKLRSGLNFEVLQAYLHRTVTIYAELILQQPEPSILASQLEAVRKAHNECSGRFRQLVQSNLCLLKMLAGLPPT